jgi:hypothetical protein
MAPLSCIWSMRPKSPMVNFICQQLNLLLKPFPIRHSCRLYAGAWTLEIRPHSQDSYSLRCYAVFLFCVFRKDIAKDAILGKLDRSHILLHLHCASNCIYSTKHGVQAFQMTGQFHHKRNILS